MNCNLRGPSLSRQHGSFVESWSSPASMTVRSPQQQRPAQTDTTQEAQKKGTSPLHSIWRGRWVRKRSTTNMKRNSPSSDPSTDPNILHRYMHACMHGYLPLPSFPAETSRLFIVHFNARRVLQLGGAQGTQSQISQLSVFSPRPVPRRNSSTHHDCTQGSRRPEGLECSRPRRKPPALGILRKSHVINSRLLLFTHSNSVCNGPWFSGRCMGSYFHEAGALASYLKPQRLGRGAGSACRTPNTNPT